VNGYLIDTHVWFWLIFDDPALTKAQRDSLTRWQSAGQLYLSPISAWEAAQKQSKGKLDLEGDVEDWVETTTAPGRLQLIDLTVHDLIAANRLPGNIHGDPADRILAATARERDLTLVTHDTPLLNYARQGHLKVHKV
jgi:PIN domain nuclease of toxin-antitoxin system